MTIRAGIFVVVYLPLIYLGWKRCKKGEKLAFSLFSCWALYMGIAVFGEVLPTLSIVHLTNQLFIPLSKGFERMLGIQME